MKANLPVNIKQTFQDMQGFKCTSHCCAQRRGESYKEDKKAEFLYHLRGGGVVVPLNFLRQAFAADHYRGVMASKSEVIESLNKLGISYREEGSRFRCSK
jgi:hypothetical protein